MKPHPLPLATTLFALTTLSPCAPALDHAKPFGEPTLLSGKRIVFTSWYFIRPGAPRWFDPGTGNDYPADAKVAAYDAAVEYPERPSGIRIVVEPAQRLGPVIRRERDWEKTGIGVNTLLNDNGKYRLWGGSSYFESSDGKNWQRPNLGLVDAAGSRDNNRIPYTITGAVFLDPTAPPDQRYKTVKHSHFEPESLPTYDGPKSVMATERGSGWYGDCIVGAVSPDGLTWTELPRPISIEPSDTQVMAAFDRQLGKYLLFTRSHMIGPRAAGQPLPQSEDKRHYIARRAIGRSDSADFQRFPLSQTIIEPGPELAPTDSYYTNCFTTVPGAPDQRLMFPSVYHQDSDTTHVELFASDDTFVWHRVPGPNVLETTAEYGAWDGGCLFAAPNLVELPGGDWALPYTGYVYPHKYPRGAWGFDVGLAVWPKGRMVALHAPDRGQFTTVAFLVPGKKLLINAVTQRAGSIQIEAAGLDGTPLPGRSFADSTPLTGDHFRTPATWKSDSTVTADPGTPIVLRFKLDKAKLYSLDFE